MITFGNTPVPMTVSWSSEETMFVAPCRYFDNRPAICQPESPGVGKPLFGKPHAVRQRRAVALDLCDLCGKSTKTRTKVSLSHAQPQPHGASGWAILQVEPMLHVECAAICIQHCPSLKRDVREGTLAIRRVTKDRSQCALMDARYVLQVAGVQMVALGHAKVELIRWEDVDLPWLESKAAGRVAA